MERTLVEGNGTLGNFGFPSFFFCVIGTSRRQIALLCLSTFHVFAFHFVCCQPGAMVSPAFPREISVYFAAILLFRAEEHILN